MGTKNEGLDLIVVLTLAFALSCTATPLPTPPSVDADRMTLLSSHQGEVTLAGEPESIRLDPMPADLRVTTPVAWTSVPLRADGSFVATLPGTLSDTLYLEGLYEDRDAFLIAISGRGSDRVEEAPSGTDRDTDGSPDVIDCAPDDVAVGGQRCDASCTPEVCNGLDDDCDGLIDEGCAEGADADSDGVTFPDDCNDSDPLVYPGAIELCNGEDDNCDANVDEGCDGNDNDGDGYPTPLDCNDTSPTTYPGAPELCNGNDDDCDVDVDEQCSDDIDADSDGYPQSVDCDDTDPSVHPGAHEVCNGVDDNCSQEIDEQCGGICAASEDCPVGGSCVEGACACDPGLSACAGACIDTQTHADHCSRCGDPCMPGQTCILGQCES